MRSPVCLILCLLFALPLWAEDAPISASPAPEAYQLGGTILRGALPPAPYPPPSAAPVVRLSVPRLIRDSGETLSRTAFGGLRLYFGQPWDQKDDIFRLGTSLTRGQTTTGFALTYGTGTEGLTETEVFLDYALNRQLRIGVSGRVSDSVTIDRDPVPQLGVNAALNTENGTYLQGGVAGNGETAPVFGVAVGLRF